MNNGNTVSARALALISELRADYRQSTDDQQRERIHATIQAVASQAVTDVSGETQVWLLMRLRWSYADVVDTRPLSDALACASEHVETATEMQRVA